MSVIRLNEAQQVAVESDAPILCCACPGSGKTRVLIAKVRHILKTHPDPRIVMTTFSRDAADEMLERIKREKGLSREQLDRLTIGTFHSLALRQLKEVGKVGKILSDIESRHLINRALHDTGLEVSIEDADAEIARCKADKEYAAANPDMARLTSVYRRHQLAMGGQDFTDLLLLANDMMATKKIKPIRATHLMADEFQDIDQMQYDWLMRHIAQNPGLCAVGDDDQSIYGFRRSLGYKGMMDFVAATGATIITLDTNYRSTDGIVSAASKLIAYNADRVQKQIKAARGHGPLPTVIGLSKEDSQAMRIVHSLDKLCASNEVPEPLPNREPYRFGVKSGQVAVLARTNAHLHAVETIFRNSRVPYLRTGRSFWDAPVLQVYVAILESLIRHDGMGLEIGLRWARMSDANIRQLNEISGGSLWRYIDPNDPVPPPATGSAEFESLVRLGRGWATKLTGRGAEQAAEGPIYGVAAWMSRVMTKTCAEDEDGNPIQEKGRREIKDLDRLEAARDSLADAKGSLSTRIRRVQENDGKEIPRVVLSTFHASKGLEWDHVFLIDVYGGSVPKVSEACKDAELAEERRVFYVAMTRARDSLTIFTRQDMPLSEFLVDAELTGNTTAPKNNNQEELDIQ
jgi:superfamily I DNA/RNA helicase